MFCPGTPARSVPRQSRTMPPGWAIWPGVSCCSGDRHQVLAGVEASLGQLGELDREFGEHVEVALGLPRRVDRRGERVHVRVHVGGADRSCFSYQVAAGSTMSDSSVELVIRKSAVISRSSLPSGASSCHFTIIRALVSPVAVRHHVVVRAEQVLEEVLVALGRGAEQVRAPQDHGARPVLGRVDVLDRRSSARRSSAWRPRRPAAVSYSPRPTAAIASSARSSGFASNCG